MTYSDIGSPTGEIYLFSETIANKVPKHYSSKTQLILANRLGFRLFISVFANVDLD